MVEIVEENAHYGWEVPAMEDDNDDQPSNKVLMRTLMQVLKVVEHQSAQLTQLQAAMDVLVPPPENPQELELSVSDLNHFYRKDE